LRDTILDVITAEKRVMYMSVYDEIRAEGRTEGKLELLLKLLAQRGLVLDDDLPARVTACTNETQIERWFDRTLTASSLAAIFDEPSERRSAHGRGIDGRVRVIS
jgi:hypothetical protein